MNKVTSKVHQYNSNLRLVFVGARHWATVPKKECTEFKRDLERQLALDPWHCERRGY